MCRHDLRAWAPLVATIASNSSASMSMRTSMSRHLMTLRPYSPATQRLATSSTTRSVLYPHDVRRKFAMMSEGYLRDGYHAGILVKPIGAIAGVDDGTCEPSGGCS